MHHAVPSVCYYESPHSDQRFRATESLLPIQSFSDVDKTILPAEIAARWAIFPVCTPSNPTE